MIHIRSIIRILGFLWLILAAFMLIPFAISCFEKADTFYAFFTTILIMLLTGLASIVLTKKKETLKMNTKDGFIFVTFAWISASAFGALPFVISYSIPSYTDAFFETMSGFTTTGASILTEIEGFPHSILFWRSLTHWLGGMGIVVLAVALLPLLGIGGAQLFKAESPGPTLDKIAPSIKDTAKILWKIYLFFTLAETVLLLFGGMNLFDALTHTFGTLATGGFSPKNSSVGAYNSAYIDVVITVFMVLAGFNFGLYYYVLLRKPGKILQNSEARAYISIFVVSTLIVAFSIKPLYGTFLNALRYAGFQNASILTTTGYATADFDKWPTLAKGVLFFLMFIGGCSGSTGGGIKVIRIITLAKQAITEIKYLIFPYGVFKVKINKEPVRKDFILTVTGFFFLYIFILLGVTLVIAGGGHDLLTAFSGALVTVGNIGPGFAKIGPTQNYSFFSPLIKWVLSFAMMAGRLEIYTVLVLFHPRFWRS
ncbi:TrkH family potassium uptake protein [Spirochaetia bacterium 38H-sp]|uniref:TrkH family potassium uptake protein n=1 Tax=Rarispira pelagica TaxID=3141764 RepID=A0ABU9UBY3_9SPIR